MRRHPFLNTSHQQIWIYASTHTQGDLNEGVPKWLPQTVDKVRLLFFQGMCVPTTKHVRALNMVCTAHMPNNLSRSAVRYRSFLSSYA